MVGMGESPCFFDMLLFDSGRSRTSEIALTTRAIARAYRIRPRLRSAFSFQICNYMAQAVIPVHYYLAVSERIHPIGTQLNRTPKVRHKTFGVHYV